MRISHIEPQKHRPRRKNIYVDGAFVTGISDETLLQFGLRTGDEVTHEVLTALQRAEEVHGAKQVALRFLGHRPRSRKEIRDKLREKEFAEDEIEDTIAVLERAGLVNDAEFARMYIRDQLALRPTGTLVLKRKLLLLGIDRQTIETVMQEFSKEIDEPQAALDAARRFVKRNAIPATPKGRLAYKRRLLAFLGRRGFTWDAVQTAQRAVLSETGNDMEME